MENIPPARVARRFGERLIGLSWSARPRALALLIPRCRSVHTFGMRFPLDLYWLGPGGDVIRVDRGVRPWRIARCAQAHAVVELPVTQVTYPGEPTRRLRRSESAVSARSSWTFS